jgi:hypothetical protein
MEGGGNGGREEKRRGRKGVYLSVCSDSSSKPGNSPSTNPWRVGPKSFPRGRKYFS